MIQFAAAAAFAVRAHLSLSAFLRTYITRTHNQRRPETPCRRRCHSSFFLALFARVFSSLPRAYVYNIIIVKIYRYFSPRPFTPVMRRVRRFSVVVSLLLFSQQLTIVKIRNYNMNKASRSRANQRISVYLSALAGFLRCN